jgi:zinc transport system substrate-binding protein
VNRMELVRAAVVCGSLVLAGCGGDSDSAAPGQPAGSQPKLNLVVSFYPLQYMAERVAGEKATVTSLTKPGAEPHDLEVTPQDVAALTEADLVVYLSGFQSSVDDAVAQMTDRAFDAREKANLNLTYTPIEEGEEQTEKAGAVDPHFWLDPTRLAGVADGFAARLGSVDAQDAALFTANAAELRADLQALDAAFSSGLAGCTSRDLVTSHNAFGYLAQRYKLRQVGITGLTPEQEPTPRRLAGVTAFVRQNKVRTIYYETLVSPAVAEAVAGETGARTEVLDPLEGLNSESRGADYLEVMRSDLANLEQGQLCS